MRVAVAFSGLPRIVDRAIESWHWLIQSYQCHVFMHLWNTDATAIQTLTSAFSPRKYFVEPLRNLDVSRYTERLQHSNPYNVLSMWTGISQGFDLVRSDDLDYDIIIRARTDVEFVPFDFIVRDGVIIPGKPAEIYTWNGHTYGGWHDMMAYGNLDSMLTYGNTLGSIEKIYDAGSPFFSEFFLSTHLYLTGTMVTHHDTYADICR